MRRRGRSAPSPTAVPIPRCAGRVSRTTAWPSPTHMYASVGVPFGCSTERLRPRPRRWSRHWRRPRHAGSPPPTTTVRRCMPSANCSRVHPAPLPSFRASKPRQAARRRLRARHDTEELDLATLVIEMSRSPDPGQRVAELQPQLALHARLVEALAMMRALAAQPDVQPPALAATLRPGQRDRAIAPLRRFLTAARVSCASSTT